MLTQPEAEIIDVQQKEYPRKKKKRKRRSLDSSASDGDNENTAKFWKSAYLELEAKYKNLAERLAIIETSSIQREVFDENTIDKSDLSHCKANSDDEISKNNDHDKSSKREYVDSNIEDDEINTEDTGANSEEEAISDDEVKHTANKKYAAIVEKNNPQPSARLNNLPGKNSGNTHKIEKIKSNKPAPIYVRQTPNKELIEFIKSIVGEGKFYTNFINKDVPETKIQIDNEQGYRRLTKELSDKKINFYTYQLKSEKGISAVIRGIESDVDVNEILQALAELNFKVKHIHNIRNRQKVQLPLFFVELQSEKSVIGQGKTHPIFELKFLLHRRIRVEDPRPKTGPIQCHNCQEFGHTKAYCSLPTVCVACGDNHLTKDCSKNKSDVTAKYCKNCAGNHTANYRGCMVYQHFKNKLNPAVTKHPLQEKYAPKRDSLTKSGLTYANVAAVTPSPEQKVQSENSLLPLLTNMMNSMNQFMKDQAVILKYIKSNHGEQH